MGHADVVGHSWGSIVAQTFAELWPQRTARVVLIASTAGPPPNRPGKTAVRLDGNHIDAPPAGGPRTERPPKRCGGEDSGW
jgi:pimeloyl-ACP methyl ester carboxylesterase